MRVKHATRKLHILRWTADHRVSEENERFHARFLFLALQKAHKHGSAVNRTRRLSKRLTREAFQQTLREINRPARTRAFPSAFGL
jgi:hypothetical protein